MDLLLDRRQKIAITAVVVLGALALLQQWVVDRRPDTKRFAAASDLIVTSAADDGAGSLREAIFAAASAQGRARIVLRVERIALRGPLPPLVNPAGVAIETANGTTIDGSAAGSAAMLDVDAPNSAISGVRFVHAAAQAILVRADGFRLMGASISDADEGVFVTDGVQRVVVEATMFENNRIGVKAESAAAGTVLRDNTFTGHRDAAVWAVRRELTGPAELGGFSIYRNQFAGDRMSIVLANTPATIERNEIVDAREIAVLLMGAGATVRHNRVRGGAGIGVFADATRGSVIEANEIDHNAALAVLVRSSRGALVRNNRVYDNGYGIAFVLNERGDPSVALDNLLLGQQNDGIVVIGDSPVLRRNAARNNRAAGLRILSFQPVSGAPIGSNPFLEANTLDGNMLNDPVRGVYRVNAPKRTGENG